MATQAQLARRPGAVGLAKAVLVRGQALAGTLRSRQPRPGLRILYYHRVSEERDPLAVTPAAFRRQMDALAGGGQRVVDLYEIDELTLDPGECAVALTFDDGYRDVLEHGLPVLREHGFPSTVFVVPGAIAGSASFSWYGAGGVPPLAGWDEMRREERTGLVHFEPHTVTHPVLTTIALEEARGEIADSKRIVEEELGREARIFCYPGGYYSAREVALVRESGYRAAVTCEFGANAAPFAHNELRRTLVERSDPLWLFRARLAGATDAPPPGRRPRRIERLAA
jgi:peptidoglycan/xylan/chitin deacetylase (PgdA/CDA1 family)